MEIGDGYILNKLVYVWDGLEWTETKLTVQSVEGGVIESSSYLKDLKDVYIPNKSDGDSLVYDKSLDKWVAKKVATNVEIPPGSSVTTENITVQLGPGGKVGNLSTGDILPIGTDLTGFIQRLVVKRIPPNYTKPTLSLSTDINLNQEYGSTISPVLKPNFKKKDN